MQISEAVSNKKRLFQNFIFNSILIIAWFIVTILSDNKISIIINSICIGLFIKDSVNIYLQYWEWRSLISKYNKKQNDIKAMTN